MTETKLEMVYLCDTMSLSFSSCKFSDQIKKDFLMDLKYSVVEDVYQFWGVEINF